MKLEEMITQEKVVSLDVLTNDTELIKDIQTRLSALGLLPVTEIDGLYGPITEAALKRFCEIAHLDNTVTGLFGPTFAKRLSTVRGPLINPPAVTSSKTVKSDVLATALKFTLLWEGGLADVKGDLGGLTNQGVTQTTYNSYRIRKKLPTQSVRNIADSEVLEIYSEMFWQPSQAELMVPPLAIAHFDTAVMFGVGGAVLFLQEALGVPVDGGFGPLTAKALEKSNTKELALKLIDGREKYHREFVQRNSDQQKFLDGWLNRVNSSQAPKIGLRTFLKSLA
ncbi:glycosyl hydrolase 108 family protein [Leptolyngbya sp. ST-U4]|uniref:glycosyl hydrolase 108 family protein n=1 Tax=Leptolyngbya sp. ST-U4 TaxID=2933912 RepID=UPI0032972BAC